MEFRPRFKEAARYSSAALLALNVLACGIPETSKSAVTPRPPVTTPSNLYPEVMAQAYPALNRYPILDRGDLKIGGSTIAWYNTTQARFNSESTQQLFSYLYSISQQKLEIKHQLPGEVLELIVEPRVRNMRYLLLAQESAPKPLWPGLEQSTLGNGATLELSDISTSFSFVRVVSDPSRFTPSRVFTSKESAVNKTFNTEACQSWIEVKAKKPALSQIGQELYCNSLASAITIRESGKTYSEYQNWAKSSTLIMGPQARLPFIVFSELDYSSIPNLNFIISGF